jgi:hypothetical protein
MTTFTIHDFVYPKKQTVEGVTLTDAEQLEYTTVSLKDFDYSPPKPIEFREDFYRANYPGLPDNAYYVLEHISAGKKSKEIRSLYKKSLKKLSVSRKQNIVFFN